MAEAPRPSPKGIGIMRRRITDYYNRQLRNVPLTLLQLQRELFDFGVVIRPENFPTLTNEELLDLVISIIQEDINPENILPNQNNNSSDDDDDPPYEDEGSDNDANDAVNMLMEIQGHGKAGSDSDDEMEGYGIPRYVFTEFAKRLYKPPNWTKPEINVAYPRHVPPKSVMLKMAKASYEAKPPQEINGEWRLVKSTPTLKFYLSEKQKTMVVAIRGTADTRDVKSWYDIAKGTLSNTPRAREDEKVIKQVKSEYPNNYYVGVGHSAGGSFLDLWIAKGYLTTGVSYNPAIEPQYIKSARNYRIYMANDPLYNIMGKYSRLGEVIGQKPVSALDSVGVVQSVKAHFLSNFKGGSVLGGPANDPVNRGKISGGASEVQKGLASEYRTWVKELREKKKLKGVENGLYKQLNEIVHSNDWDADPKNNRFIDHFNEFSLKADKVIDDSEKVLRRWGLTPPHYPTNYADFPPATPPEATITAPLVSVQSMDRDEDEDGDYGPSPNYAEIQDKANVNPNRKHLLDYLPPQALNELLPKLPAYVPPKKKGKGKKKEKTYTMPLTDLITEHKRLIQILMSGTSAERHKEAKDQQEELDKYLGLVTE